ncbi:hypothetical protein [Pseudomonas chlororaphis]|uniref:DUF4142 domain-containing protein n=1 Tax=Pseudomonas chlororaphis TaxID=587753 RepID=A0AAX3FPQ2_9PSED|nr:hypothetical protein [Pseudomonas chlororaphis]AZC38163.1 hypothetical protein C4K37_3778 [Pseudomonas chlororaphis subsp. piscium]AZC44709.1 hypothetical protein C4K36_3786 [Pseudomonas chlororaphis subsp. piscium]WDG70321.1 hypothetical protein PUP65_19610 [Pseudomonas chlororaphis]WDH31893.1 hypothetical protein PUP81_14710 [Pseudomonas chlororaphis]WDH68847.1 hypothetical protein PUP78_19595 [Pseudomonas chlororaphis]
MKRSTLVIACLLSVTSVAAFAEDGSDRARARWEAFQASHVQAHGEAAQKTLTAQTKNNGSSAVGTTGQKQQPDT